MKITTAIAVAATLAQHIGAIAAVAISNPDDGALTDAQEAPQTDFELVERSTDHEKWKRKGGGGGGGRGGGGSSGGSSSGSGSGRGSGKFITTPIAKGAFATALFVALATNSFSSSFSQEAPAQEDPAHQDQAGMSCQASPRSIINCKQLQQ